ncbi:glycoside hydrolase superfamily [Gongronella butleri]|nr:glycoside hydrolase superfamily [Gongronella butleri]
MVGYFPNWLYDAYSLSNIDFAKYTHINYAFAIMIKGATPEYADPSEVKTQLPQLVQMAHAANTKVLLSIGGWTGCITFSTMAANATQRQTFINWVQTEIKTYNLDGVDIDWEYPGQAGAGCNKFSVANDANNFLTLLQEMRQALGTTKDISIAAYVRPFTVSGGRMKDVSAFAAVVDRFNLMAYDINGSWNSITGPTAPFNFQQGQGDQDSFVSAIDAWMTAGVPASKIVPGLAFYGNSATATVDMTNTDQYQPQVAGVAPQGDSSDSYWQDPYCSKDPGGYSGVWNYANLRSQGLLTTPTTAGAPWIRHFDNITQTPWLFNPTTKVFISYDDPISIGVKTDYAISKNLGGLMCWSLDGDNGELLAVAYKIVNSGGGSTTTTTTTTSSQTTTTTFTTTSTTTASTTSSSSPTSTGTGGACAGVSAWSASTSYTTGSKVTYSGSLWQAKWWTYGDTPGGSAGVWAKQGAC